MNIAASDKMRNKPSQKLYCYDSKSIPSSFVMTLGCEIQSGIFECQQIFASLIPGDIASNFIWNEGRVILSEATNWALMKLFASVAIQIPQLILYAIIVPTSTSTSTSTSTYRECL
ncbi:hypothetical protein GQX74_003147 [Glossina fuscipes]|nr:hypothetical protein GQX74_003147 [Glossina fuscipes]